MKQNHFRITGLAIFSFALMISCTKKLDLTPTLGITPDKVYSTALGYKQSLAKVYAAMALTGNSGGTGSPDIPSQIISDEGNSDFLRQFWYLQCLTTDEAGWTYHNNTDPVGIHQMTWSSVNQTVGGLYYRSLFQITLANDFIRQSSDANLSSRGITGSSADSVKKYSGWIYGAGHNSQWTQVLAYGKVKYRLYNPIMQNSKHVSDLRQQLSQFENVPFYSIVVFYGNCVLKDINFVSDRTFLVKSNGVLQVMETIMKNNELARYTNKSEIVRVLKEAAKNGEDKKIQLQHIKNIKGTPGKDSIFD